MLQPKRSLTISSYSLAQPVQSVVLGTGVGGVQTWEYGMFVERGGYFSYHTRSVHGLAECPNIDAPRYRRAWVAVAVGGNQRDLVPGSRATAVEPARK